MGHGLSAIDSTDTDQRISWHFRDRIKKAKQTRSEKLHRKSNITIVMVF